jgi:hypothetical protein
MALADIAHAMVVQGVNNEIPFFGALTHWLSTCLSNRMKRVRFPHASPRLSIAPLAQSWQTRHAQTVDVPSSTLGRCTTSVLSSWRNR